MIFFMQTLEIIRVEKEIKQRQKKPCELHSKIKKQKKKLK